MPGGTYVRLWRASAGGTCQNRARETDDVVASAHRVSVCGCCLSWAPPQSGSLRLPRYGVKPEHADASSSPPPPTNCRDEATVWRLACSVPTAMETRLPAPGTFPGPTTPGTKRLRYPTSEGTGYS